MVSFVSAALITITCLSHVITCDEPVSLHDIIWNPPSATLIKLKKEVHEFEISGITIKTATCEEKPACTEKGYGVAYQPDLYVFIDYGEFDEYGMGSRHRVGFFGKTPQVRKSNTADFGAAMFKYVRGNKTHQYRVRTNGYFDVQLYDGDTVLYKPVFLGYTYVNVTEFGPGERTLTGTTATRITFDVFGALKRDPAHAVTTSTSSTTAAP